MLVGLVCGLAVLVGFGAAVVNGWLHLNNPSAEHYPVRGVDVSRYQGTIDWPRIAAQNIQFAYLKATEGSSHVDPTFAINLDGSRAAGLRTGAYHFFSFSSPGDTQADNVIRTVPKQDGMLPVAVDLEFYDSYWLQPAPADQVRRELTALLARLQQHYRSPAMLYVTAEAYDRYITGHFPGLEVWIRDVWRSPTLSDGRPWRFWQFSDRHRLAGYAGEEPFIDLNVFAGSREDWERYRR